MSKPSTKYPNFEKLSQQSKVQFYLALVFLIIPITLIILGIILDTETFNKLTMIALGVFFLIVCSFVIIFRFPKKIAKIRELTYKGDEDSIVRYIEQVKPGHYYAIYALMDLNPLKLEPHIDFIKRHYARSKQSSNTYRDSLHDKVIALIREQEKHMLKEQIEDLSSKETIKGDDLAVSIEKVVFVKNEKALTKCMISKTQLTLNETVVVCPFCGNMAKKELLEEWLRENKSCPVCMKKLRIQDCPLVDVRG